MRNYLPRIPTPLLSHPSKKQPLARKSSSRNRKIKTPLKSISRREMRSIWERWRRSIFQSRWGRNNGCFHSVIMNCLTINSRLLKISSPSEPRARVMLVVNAISRVCWAATRSDPRTFWRAAVPLWKNSAVTSGHLLASWWLRKPVAGGIN